MNSKHVLVGMAFAASLGLASVANAIDLDAGDYDTAPAGTTLGLLYLQSGKSDGLYQGSTKQPGDDVLDSDTEILRLVHYTTIFDHLAAPQILLPFAQVKGEDDVSDLGSASGIGDAILAAPVWFLNDTQQHEYFGVTPYLFLPTGNYDANNPLNIGDHRWKGNLQAAYSRRLASNIAWDAAADVTFYGDNSDPAGGGTLSQDPGYQVQTNARYLLSDTSDLRAGISYADAGKTTQNGVTSAAYTESKFWVGGALFVLPKTQVILTYGRDIAVENGFKDVDQINIRLLQVF